MFALGASIDFEVLDNPCELCGFAAWEVVAKEVTFEEGSFVEWPVYACDFCGLLAQRPILSQAFYDNYYRNSYSERLIVRGDSRSNLEYFFEDQKDRGQHLHKWLKQSIPNFFDLKLGRVMDLGSSSGGMLLPFALGGFDVYGNDPDELLIEYGRNRGVPNLICEKAENLSYSKKFFDMILVIGSLEHVWDLNLVMKKCSEYIKPGGLMVVSGRGTPVKHSKVYFNHHHHRYFTYETFELLMLKYGFSPIPIDTFNILGPKRAQSIVCVSKKTQMEVLKGQFFSRINKGKAKGIIDYFRSHDSGL